MRRGRRRWSPIVLIIGALLIAGCSSEPADTADEPAQDVTPSAGASTDDDRREATTGASLDALVDWRTPHPDHPTDSLASITAGPIKQVTAFFPAKANLQWLAADIEDYDHPVAGEGSTTTHPGGALTEPCANCHADDGIAPHPRELGQRLVEASDDAADKRPYVDVDLRAAFDEQYLYLQASWTSDRPRPGVTHQHFQFDGDHWARDVTAKEGDTTDVDDLDDGALFDYEDRLAVMFAPQGQGIHAFGDDDGPSFDDIGCAVGCHASMRNMPNKPDAQEVADHPYLGDEGLGNDDIRHYLLDTRHADDRRDPDGAWAAIDADFDAAQRRDDGRFLDLWQYRGGRSAAMYGASNDYVMDYRFSGVTGHNYWFNQDPSSQPEDAQDLVFDDDDHRWLDTQGEPVDVSDYAWMYDAHITGFHALPDHAVDDDHRDIQATWSARTPLIAEGPDRNAVPLDDEVLDEGDLLTRRVLRHAAGTRARVDAFSHWQPLTQRYTLTLRRSLDPADGDHDLRPILDGHPITAAFAVFDDHSSNRYHHITFPLSIGPDDDADLQARDLR